MLTIGKLELQETGPVNVTGQSVSGVVGPGVAAEWVVSRPPGVRLTIRDTHWQTGERDISVARANNPLPPGAGAPWPLSRLEHGLRMSVLSSGQKRFVELQIAKVDPDSPGMWSSTYKATPEDFETICGTDWKQILLGAGATSVNTRERALGDTSRRKSYLSAVFPEASDAPVIAYCLTRVLPLLGLWSPIHAPRTPLPNQRRVYVVGLSDQAGQRGLPGRPKVYVGETARTPEARLETHRQGGRTASGISTGMA